MAAPETEGKYHMTAYVIGALVWVAAIILCCVAGDRLSAEADD